MTKREKILNKFGGHCAYCGCELGKHWHADHLEPVGRYLVSIGFDKEKWESIYEERQGRPNDKFENMMPACASCNLYKSTYNLETFRQQIGLLVERLNRTYTQYKISKRFGLIVETPKPIIFYFEQQHT